MCFLCLTSLPPNNTPTDQRIPYPTLFRARRQYTAWRPDSCTRGLRITAQVETTGLRMRRLFLGQALRAVATGSGGMALVDGDAVAILDPLDIPRVDPESAIDRKSTRLNSSH